ncbi:DUF4421 family protein [Breznakiellaceae bacterium SP9]
MSKIYLRIGIIRVLFCLFAAHFAFSEETISTFDEKFALNVYGNYSMGIFDQNQAQYSYVTEELVKIGLGFRYKAFSAGLSIPINLNFTSMDLELSTYFEKVFFELHLKHYQNYYVDNNTYENTDFDIISAGIMAGWVHNNQHHSLSSIYDLDKKQNISSGSLLYGFGVFYTSIYSESNEIEHYNERKHIIHFGPMGGYSYTLVLSYDIFVNIGIFGGINLGMSTTENKILFIPQVRPKIGFGHHSGTWSINMIFGGNAAFIIWDKSDYDILQPVTMKIMLSKRF